ncbi:unnamed protein product [Effrenium voratum]|uniref:Uncharacterized protein n=1 Tax=Effrenium voratum TaxID=2562239 RepID=A0AA36JP85_9DINO|nr:unnamed protein product [Effrenium voratum]
MVCWWNSSSQQGSRAARLWRLLRSCCAAQRRQLLLQFSEAQRKALEQWILAHPEVRGKLRRSGKPSAVRRSGFVHPRSRSGVHGIETFSRQGKLLYRASAKLGPFRIMTGYCKDLLLAKQHLQALQCSLAQVGATEVPDNLRSLAQAELDLDLRFFAELPCRQLKTPCLKLRTGLQAGLQAFQRLQKLLNGDLLSLEASWMKVQAICDEAWKKKRKKKKQEKKKKKKEKEKKRQKTKT